MYCQACGSKAPTKHVTFYQNIGLLILRLSKSIDGELCKPCVHKYFWEFTSINLLLGWWGIISFFFNWFFLLNNVVQYLGCLGMPSPDAAGRGEPAATVAPLPRRGADAGSRDECYFCGRPLQPHEVQARVCEICR
jgi:hypothetical protein